MWLCIECTKQYKSRFSFINMQLYAKLNVIFRFWWKATCTEELLYFMQCSKLRLLKVKHIIFSYSQIVSIRYKFDWCPPTKKFTTHQPPLKINIIHLFNGSLIVGANRLISTKYLLRKSHNGEMQRKRHDFPWKTVSFSSNIDNIYIFDMSRLNKPKCPPLRRFP